jgi:hypothetical protein
MSISRCPGCNREMKKQLTLKDLKATDYYCMTCGQFYTKVQGECGYRNCQVTNLRVSE